MNLFCNTYLYKQQYIFIYITQNYYTYLSASKQHIRIYLKNLLINLPCVSPLNNHLQIKHSCIKNSLKIYEKIIKFKFLVLFLESLLDSEQCLFGSLSAISAELPGSTNHSSETSFALPYSNGLSLDLVLTTELAVVFGMLGNLVFFDYLSH